LGTQQIKAVSKRIWLLLFQPCWTGFL